MSDIAIKIHNIGKKYRIGERYNKYQTLRYNISSFSSKKFKSVISAIGKNRANHNNSRKSGTELALSDENEKLVGKMDQAEKIKDSLNNIVWSLRNVSFNIARGEIVGIIGRNGAGKSTLMKIISGITEPSEGRIEIYGRIGSLLEVGTGFHPELTGRENIYLNGAIMGMKKREIDEKFDEIVAFSEVEKFIDTPVKFYSSGMRVRLGFSVAAHLEPEILIIDEVLAVGDAAFQKKCLGKLDEVSTADGRTVLFVTHDMASIQSLCSRVILLENGEMVAEGSAKKIVDQYINSMSSFEAIPLIDRKDADKSNDNSVTATSLEIENLKTDEPIRPTSQIVFKIGYKSENKEPIRNLVVQVVIRDAKTGRGLTLLNSDNSVGMPELLPPQGTIVCVTDRTYITPGKCVIDICFLKGTTYVYVLENAGSFNVEEEIVYGSQNITRDWCAYLLKHTWSIEK